MTQPKAHDPVLTRATLLLRLKPGEPAREVAWQQFQALYAPIIGGFARKMGVKPQDIPDVLQDVLLGFFSAMPTFSYDPGKGRFRGYLKTCTWRIVERKLGKERKATGSSLDRVDPTEVQVEAVWNDIWEREKLQQALAIVRDRYLSRPDKAKTFRAFEMYVLLDRDPATVAGELGMSPDSVHQAKARVSKALKVEMAAMDESVG